MAIRKPSHPEAGLEREVVHGSAEWNAAQAEVKRKNHILTGDCHPWADAMTVGVFLFSDDRSSVRQIGKTWICSASEWNFKERRTDYCFQVVKNGGTTMRAFKKDWPQDFTQEIWDDMKAVGAMVEKGGHGFYCIRKDGVLEAFTTQGRERRWFPRPQNLKFEGKAPSHGYARVDAKAHDAYAPDEVVLDEPMEDVPF